MAPAPGQSAPAPGDPAPHDAALAEGLARWLTEQRGLTGATVGNLSRPSAGYSSETVFADVTWAGRASTDVVGTDRAGTDVGDGARSADNHHERLVVRMAPPVVGTFRHYDLVSQWQAQTAAAAVGVPVADPVVETDSRLVGAPFMVMPRVEGHIIGALAHRDPWLRET